MGHDGWGDQLQRAESVDSSTWPNIRQARGTHWPARDALANGATQQQRRRARAGGVPGQVPQARRAAAVGVPKLLADADPSRDRRRRKERGVVASPSRAHSAVADALHECTHEEVLHLIDAEPTVASRVIARTMKLQEQQESQHSGDAPGFAAVRDAKFSEARADMRERA